MLEPQINLPRKFFLQKPFQPQESMYVFSSFFELHDQIDVAWNILCMAYKTPKKPQTGNTERIS